MAASVQNLSNEARDWTAVGIGLNVVLAPLLREYVDKKLEMLYNHLDHNFNISDERRNSLLQLTRNRSQYGAYHDFGFNYNNQVQIPR